MTRKTGKMVGTTDRAELAKAINAETARHTPSKQIWPYAEPHATNY
jgi:hypothetical protein